MKRDSLKDYPHNTPQRNGGDALEGERIAIQGRTKSKHRVVHMTGKDQGIQMYVKGNAFAVIEMPFVLNKTPSS